MKIIENGEKKTLMQLYLPVHRIRCSECNCLFEFKEIDVKIIDVPAQEYEENVYCPCCKKKIDVQNRIQY